METLSQILRATRMRSPLIVDLRLADNLSIGLPALGGLPFHYVVKGACQLDTGSERTDLKTGDFVMLARLPYYRLETGSGARRVEVMEFAERDNFSANDLHTGTDHLFTRDVGDAPMAAQIFSAILMPGDREGNPLIRDLPIVTILRDVKSSLETWLVAAIDFISSEAQEREPGLSAVLERLIEVIFIAVLRNWLLKGDHKRGWMRGLTDPTVSRVLNAMHADPGKRWTLRDLATASGRSRSGLAKHFREVMDETPFAYLGRWRMHLAASAVARSSRSIADIAVSSGYGGSLAFSRSFSSTFGETPAQYRRRCRAGAAVKL